MGLKDDLEKEIDQIFRVQNWTTRDGNKVPESEDLGFGNEAVKLEGTVLYADLSDSTKLVDQHKPHFAAEVYKAYLRCAAKIIRDEGGSIAAYDGDRIMAVFIGDLKNTSAARCALRINYAVVHIINPMLRSCYSDKGFTLRQVVGIDTSSLWVARTGIRGSNDLVWVGRAANYAAKLTALSADYPSRITKDVYQKLPASLKQAQDGRSMWESVNWTDMGNMEIYRSTWWWSF